MKSTKKSWKVKLVWILLTVAAVAAVAVLAGYLFIRQEKFGRLPEGQRLERTKSSPNYMPQEFKNLIPTSVQTEGVTFADMMWDYWFGKHERLIPSAPLPTVKTDLLNLDPGRDILVWLGHSSFFMRLNGKTFLADPVLSQNASPVSFTTKAFPGTSIYVPEDLPYIDYLIISHDHWDHLDYQTVTALRSKIGKVVCGLGVGEHFERWGFEASSLIEADWYESVELEPDLTIHIRPVRHFSGRALKRNQTLWVSFVFESNQRRIYYSGDSGYGPHFSEIGDEFKQFDLVILENGQYDQNWKYIHMMPEETSQAALDLRAKSVVPVHFGKFSISSHSWDEPVTRLHQSSQGQPYRLLTPMIGEIVYLDESEQTFSRWWENLD